ncbi:MAG: hypothetical protein KF912_13145 [Phycisphaeraceae bacterium]|nr:hypothetical protein [Phycisphaeraceae bacterium]MBX3368251.1 hypothetical protein [Phycisphaeraceae bacterium]
MESLPFTHQPPHGRRTQTHIPHTPVHRTAIKNASLARAAHATDPHPMRAEAKPVSLPSIRGPLFTNLHWAFLAWLATFEAAWAIRWLLHLL